MNTPVSKSKRAASSPLEQIDLKKTRDFSPGNTSDLSELSDLSDTEMAGFSDNDITRIVSAMEEKIEHIVNRAVDNLTKELKLLREENIRLDYRNKELLSYAEELESRIEEGEQYSRRNNLRITGIAETEGESTDGIVLEMAQKLGVALSITDIDRSHRVGRVPHKESGATGANQRPSKVKHRAIIIKFTSWRSRQIFYKARTSAKDNGYKDIYVNEDLRKYRNNLLYEARKLKKAGKLIGAWSAGGVIFVKDERERTHKIAKLSQLEFYE